MADTIGPILFSVLSADVATQALVGTRIYPNEIPQGAQLPAIVYHVVSDIPESSFTGRVETTTSSARVQIDCHARALGSVGAYAGAHAVAACVLNVIGNLARSDLSGFVDSAARDIYDNATQYHIVQQDFTIWR